jgi:hypothetical protein
MQEGDKTEITGLRSGWTQIKLYKTIVGYIRLGGPALEPVAAPVTAASMPPPPAPAGATATPPVSTGPAAAALPQTVQGMLVETKRFLIIGRRPDFDYQLNDTNGKRIAFLDLSKIATTQKIEPYVDSPVVVSGVIAQTDDWKNIVITVQTLEAH